MIRRYSSSPLVRRFRACYLVYTGEGINHVFKGELRAELPCFYAYAGWVGIMKIQRKGAERAKGDEEEMKKSQMLLISALFAVDFMTLWFVDEKQPVPPNVSQ